MKLRTERQELYDKKLIQKQQIEKDLKVEMWAKKAKLAINTVSKIRNGRDLRVSNLLRGLRTVGLTIAVVPLEPQGRAKGQHNGHA